MLIQKKMCPLPPTAFGIVINFKHGQLSVVATEARPSNGLGFYLYTYDPNYQKLKNNSHILPLNT